MIHIEKPENCSGCTACQSICGHDAIHFKRDALGFIYPQVDSSKCVNCGLCEKVCAFNDDYDTSRNYTAPIVYGVRHKEIDEVMRSRSGATFVAISDYVLKNGGVIYGVGFRDDLTVCHKRATNKIERDEFRGSKYVQSDLTGIFKQIRQDLINGKTVMFVGTPCQTAGLNSYIGKKLRNNLILVDIICHGVPSNNLWLEYVKYIEEIHKSKIRVVNFRDKKMFGWDSHRETYLFENEDTFKPVESNFYNRIFLRKSCGVCHYCNTKRPSDITIGDFWGWERTNISLNNDNMGLNILLINTPLGNEIFNAIKGELVFLKIDDDSYKQPNLCAPTKMHPYRDLIEKDYSNKGFEYIMTHNYDKPTLWDRLRRQILLRTPKK